MAVARTGRRNWLARGRRAAKASTVLAQRIVNEITNSSRAASCVPSANMLKRNTLGAGLGAAAGVHGYWSGSSLAGRHFSRISTPQSAPIAGRHTVDPGSGRGERTHAAMRKDLDETRLYFERPNV